MRRPSPLLIRAGGIAAATILAVGAVVAMAARSSGAASGFVRIVTVPSTAVTVLFLDGEPVPPSRDRAVVVRQAVGTRDLQMRDRGGHLGTVCRVAVRQDRITDVTVSSAERPPQCRCHWERGMCAS